MRTLPASSELQTASVSSPIFSVVIPLYNTERYIEEALRSVQAQDFTDYEVIVVNDASSDAGPDIVKTFMQSDKRIRMITQKNRGLAGARNTGIRAAKGRYIALLDADDFWKSDKLSRHARHLDNNPRIGVSYAPSLLVDDESNSLGLVQQGKNRYVDAATVFCRNPVGNGSAAVLRAAMLDEIAFTVPSGTVPSGEETRICWFDESFRQSEDIELWTRIAITTNWQFEGLDVPLTCYRVNAEGLSANTDRQMETWQRFANKVKSYAPDFYQTHAGRAKAYQQRYLARRAAISGDGGKGLKLFFQALKNHPAILREEGMKTVQTLLLNLLSLLVPTRFFTPLKTALFSALSLGRKFWGRSPASLRPALPTQAGNAERTRQVQ